jgi:ABC-type multidrug transport system ATPase subunit/ABC-type multidrug transport system permease subunit
MELKWQTLSVTRNQRKLLNNLSGNLESGSCLAIMGSSGAGKTTFLGVLSGEKKDFTGLLKISGKDPKSVRPLVGYVRQYECFLEYLTPREHLFYQQKLFNPLESETRIHKEVSQALKNFHLEKCSDTIIGNPIKNKGLSGGERKRLAIATEVFWRPKLLLLDEPTSGLDHHSATAVLECLSRVKNEGITIIMSIHQPSYRSYSLFDKIMVMAEGEAIYYGLADFEPMARFLNDYSSIESGYLSTMSTYNRLDPKFIPPHEVLIEIASDPNQKHTREEMVKGCKCISELSLSDIKTEVISESSIRTLRPNRGCAIEILRCLYLCYRDYLNSKRNPRVTKLKVFQSIFLAFLVCLLYSRNNQDTHSVQNITGAMFFIIMNLVFSSSFGVLRIFTQHLNVFRREYSKRWYSLTSYYVAKTSSDIIFQILTPIVFFTPVYWIVDFRQTVDAFFWSLATVLILCLCSCSWGYFIACIAPGSDIVNIISPTLLLPFLIAGGFLVNSGSLPSYISWLSNLSFFRYAYENLMILEWKNRVLKCDSLQEVCLYTSGDEVLEFFSIDKTQFWMNTFQMIILLLGCRLLGFLLLYRKTRFY